jgi:hypothetical protein
MHWLCVALPKPDNLTVVPTRVRDCVAKQFFEVVLQQADASRRQSGPRKTTLGR